jgi:hypothetical protein
MTKSSPHHPAGHYRSVDSLQNLAQLFRQLSQELKGLVQYTHSDFQQRIADLKKNLETWEELRIQVDICRANAGPGWYESAVVPLEEIKQLFNNTMEQMQYYDLLQQQLEHIVHAYDEMLGELEEQIRVDQFVPVLSRDFLSVLPELVQLHSAQLTLVCKQYEAAVLAWHNQQSALFLCVGGWLRQVEDTSKSGDHQIPFDALLLRLRRLDATMHGRVQGRKQKGEPGSFEAAVAGMQQQLVRILSEATILPVQAKREVKAIALDRIRRRYTMQSERTLHDRILKAYKMPEEKLPAPNDENQDVELF